MPTLLPTIALTSGEPAGIGPDLCVMLAAHDIDARLAVLGDAGMLAERAALLGIPLELTQLPNIAQAPPHRRGALSVLHVPAAAPPVPGRLDVANGPYVLELLSVACDACMAGDAEALVTAPVQKSIITQSGVRFSGHTEFFAERTGAPLPVMMLAAGTRRVALVTTHLPLADVPAAITAQRLEQTALILHADLIGRFRIPAPRILVLGLNPHAGEHGTLGREEQDIIEPTLARLAEHGLQLIGPVAGDTAFTDESLTRCDAVLAMYHDQGLGPLKALAFGAVVNVTLGLPIIRTSVDHGTALPLAGTSRARPDSLIAALDLARELACRARARP